jgi:hypothetical protein
MSVEPAIPHHLRCPRTEPSRMPVEFKAPFPVWMAPLGDAMQLRLWHEVMVLWAET